MQSIYLIRHARTQANLKGILCGKTESELIDSQNDIKNQILSKIGKFGDPVVISSPRKRSFFTAKSLGFEVVVEDGISEFDFGDFEGMTHDEIKMKFPELFQKLYDDSENFKYPGGEDKKIFFSRVTHSYEIIKEKYKKSNEIVIVSHSGVIQALISYILLKNDSLYWNFKIDNCTVIKLYYCEEVPVIEYVK